MIYGLTSNHLSDPILWAVAQYSSVNVSQLHTFNAHGQRVIKLNSLELMKKLKLQSSTSDFLPVLSSHDMNYCDMLVYLLSQLKRYDGWIQDTYNVIIKSGIESGPTMMLSPIVDYLIEKSESITPDDHNDLGIMVSKLMILGHTNSLKQTLRFYVVTLQTLVTYCMHTPLCSSNKMHHDVWISAVNYQPYGCSGKKISELDRCL